MKLHHIFFIIFLTLIISFNFVGCKEDDDSSILTNLPADATTDVTAPTVSSVSPGDSSSDIQLDTSISITFSEVMDTSSITTNTTDTICSSSIQLSSSDFVNCVKMSDPSADTEKKVFTIQPTSTLDFGTTYKIKVTTAVTDLAGNTLGAEYVYENGFSTVNNDAKTITAFSFTDDTNTVLSSDVTATISDISISATVPLGTDVTALIATFTTTGASVSVSDTTQVSATTANDFSSAVIYTVTAADGSTQDYTVSVVASAQSTDYFKYSEGHGIRYHVTDEEGGFDVNAWAVSQYHENDNSHDLDFVFTLNRESAGNLDNSLGGKLNQNIDGVGLTRFQSGYPCGNQGNFYMNFSLPNSFYSGMQWSLSWGPIAYSVEYVGSQTINGTTFPDTIKVYIDDSSNDSDYLKGTGYFTLAKDIGIVQIVFNRTNGNTVQFDYMTHGQLTKHVISGIVEVTSGNAAVGKVVQISNGNWGIRSVTAVDGSFSLEAYGPDIMLRIGDDTDNNDILDFVPEMPKQVWVNDITSNVTGVSIVLNP
jgi:hypothetical protein